MTKARQIALDDRDDRLIEQLTASGRYASADDIVSAGLRLLDQQERKLEGLRAALAEGEASGDARVIDREAFLRSLSSD